MHQFRFRRQRGVTLIELLVASAILAIVVLGTAQLTFSLFSVQREISLSSAQNSLAAEVRKYLGSRSVFVATMRAMDGGSRKNPALFNCACGVGNCTSRESPTPVLTVHLSDAEILSPKSFDETGNSCDPAALQCAFNLRTQYFAVCPPNFAGLSQEEQATCNGQRAEFFAVQYFIEPTQKTIDATRGNVVAVSGWTFLDVGRVSLTPAECL